MILIGSKYATNMLRESMVQPKNKALITCQVFYAHSYIPRSSVFFFNGKDENGTWLLQSQIRTAVASLLLIITITLASLTLKSKR